MINFQFLNIFQIWILVFLHFEVSAIPMSLPYNELEQTMKGRIIPDIDFYYLNNYPSSDIKKWDIQQNSNKNHERKFLKSNLLRTKPETEDYTEYFENDENDDKGNINYKTNKNYNENYKREQLIPNKNFIHDSRNNIALADNKITKKFNYNQKRNSPIATNLNLQKTNTKFIPSISIGAMAHMGEFFNNLKNNINFLETTDFTDDQIQLIEGHHPIKALSIENGKLENPKHSGTAAFLSAFRTYQPSQKIRSLISTEPDGYHGSSFNDPNYMWVGLGK